ncbi:MAG: RlmE family RNA methyltransferase, partial [Fimbriimonadaceae bacterium]|nr:RlmE family RNA methyltransferase [Alphaproteobacteria bacterium]
PLQHAWAPKLKSGLFEMAKHGSTPSGGRDLRTRVKTARGRKTGSTRWLDRQLNDPYVAEARRKGYRSRAAFKLIEIDDRYPILKPGQRVIDLGAAPGGWAQVIAKKIAAEQEDGGVLVAIDLLEMEPVAGAKILQLDFLDAAAPEILKDLLGGPADLVLSDMAANTTGHRPTDHLRIIALCEVALDFASEVLAPGGAFLAKVFQGGTENELLARMKKEFKTVRHVKPNASRSDSAETYVLATGFRGGQDQTEKEIEED